MFLSFTVSHHIHASDPGSQVAEGLQEEAVMVVRLIKKEKDWDYKRKECVEAKCFDKYFVMVCVTGDTITGPETAKLLDHVQSTV